MKTLAIVVVLVLLLACVINASAAAVKDDQVAQVLKLDRQYWEGERTKDWSKVAALVAPDYYGIGEDLEIDFKELHDDFAKIDLAGYQIGTPHIRRLSADYILVSYIATMHETYDGKDISGRYWTSTTWVRRNRKWLLLVEQEVRLGPNESTSAAGSHP